MRALVFLFLAVPVAGAALAQPGPGGGPAAPVATRDVVGVAADDVLNVRSEPSGTAPVVGALSPLAGGLKIQNVQNGWTLIEHRGIKGWVASRFLARSEALVPPTSGAWECSGTEPFWSLTTRGEEVAFATPEGGRRVSRMTGLLLSANTPDTWFFRFEDGTAQAVVEGGTVCSDGMGDRIHRRMVHVVRGGRMVSGCCRRP